VTENENENENEKDERDEKNERDERDEDENDEIENKQHCRKRLSRYTKTDDAKSEDVVNRLHFMKLKS
jgi:hypothetical protein